MEKIILQRMLESFSVSENVNIDALTTQYNKQNKWYQMMQDDKYNLNLPIRTINTIADVILSPSPEFRVPEIYTSETNVNNLIESELYSKLRIDINLYQVILLFLSLGNLLVSFVVSDDTIYPNFIPATNVIPISYDLYDVNECLWWVEKNVNNEKYIILTRESLDSREVKIFKVVGDSSLVEANELGEIKKSKIKWNKDESKKFFWLSTNIKTYDNIGTPFSNSVYHQETLIMACEKFWKAIDLEIKQSKKQIFVAKDAIRGGFNFDKVRTPQGDQEKNIGQLDPDSELWTVLNIDDKHKPVGEFNPQIRINDLTMALDLSLTNYSQAIGMGNSLFSYKKQTGEVEKTQLEILMTNRDAYNTIHRYRAVLEKMLRWLIVVMSEEWVKLGKLTQPTKELDVKVDFNEGIFVNPKDVKNEGILLYQTKDQSGAPLISRKFLLKHYFNYDDEMIKDSEQDEDEMNGEYSQNSFGNENNQLNNEDNFNAKDENEFANDLGNEVNNSNQ